VRGVFSNTLSGPGTYNFNVSNDQRFSMTIVCPGCNEQKRLPLHGKGKWLWNDDWHKPTLHPMVEHDNCKWSLTEGVWRNEDI
jgi:hypothetical protein